MKPTSKWLPPVVVPNTTDTTLVIFYGDDDADVYEHRHHPIIAWLVTVDDEGAFKWTTPVIADHEALEVVNMVYCYEVRAGGCTRWQFEFGHNEKTLEDACTHAYAQLRRCAERRQAKARLKAATT